MRVKSKIKKKKKRPTRRPGRWDVNKSRVTTQSVLKGSQWIETRDLDQVINPRKNGVESPHQSVGPRVGSRPAAAGHCWAHCHVTISWRRWGRSSSGTRSHGWSILAGGLTCQLFQSDVTIKTDTSFFVCYTYFSWPHHMNQSSHLQRLINLAPMMRLDRRQMGRAGQWWRRHRAVCTWTASSSRHFKGQIFLFLFF